MGRITARLPVLAVVKVLPVIAGNDPQSPEKALSLQAKKIIMGQGFLYFKFSTILNASKNKDYKIMVTENCTALMNFLIEKKLLNVEPLDSNGIIKEDIELRTSDFKNKGELLFGKPVMKCFKYLDKSGNIDNFSILEKELEKIKNNNVSD